MSLVIALSDPNNLWIAADTVAYDTDKGALPNPASKIRVFCGDDSQLVVAIAGESTINNKHLFVHIERRLAELQTDSSLEGLLRYLQEQWYIDVEGYCWDSP